jgi:hypothetical protein
MQLRWILPSPGQILSDRCEESTLSGCPRDYIRLARILVFEVSRFCRYASRMDPRRPRQSAVPRQWSYPMLGPKPIGHLQQRPLGRRGTGLRHSRSRCYKNAKQNNESSDQTDLVAR